jgi:hypothetical protein
MIRLRLPAQLGPVPTARVRQALQMVGQERLVTDLEARIGLSRSVAVYLCSTAHPLHTRFTKIFGASISEATICDRTARLG